jgi:hypothetical protein
MTLAEKQHAARLDFISNWLEDANIVANYNDMDIIIATNNENFPYIKLSIAALDEERGATKAFELIIKQSASNDIMYKRRLKKEQATL